jgi:hypothetical protein
MEYNQKHPTTPFKPQCGPVFTICPVLIETNRAKNFTIIDVVEVLFHNLISPNWISHSYPFGLQMLEYLTQRHSEDYKHLCYVDDQQLSHLHQYSEPPGIEAWCGWRYPTHDDYLCMINAFESVANRCNTDARVVEEWVRAGDPTTYKYLTCREYPTTTEEYRTTGNPLPSTQAGPSRTTSDLIRCERSHTPEDSPLIPHTSCPDATTSSGSCHRSRSASPVRSSGPPSHSCSLSSRPTKTDCCTI